MSHNQTIDGVSRKSLEQALKLAAVFDDGGDGADAESARGVVWILRALLDAPAVLGEIDLTPKRLAHAEIVIEQQNNLIASLRAELVESYRVAAQPQGEPDALRKGLEELIRHPSMSFHQVALLEGVLSCGSKAAHNKVEPVGCRYRKTDLPDRAWSYSGEPAANWAGYEFQHLYAEQTQGATPDDDKSHPRFIAGYTAGLHDYKLGQPQGEPVAIERLSIQMLKGGLFRYDSDPEGPLVRYQDHAEQVEGLRLDLDRLNRIKLALAEKVTVHADNCAVYRAKLAEQPAPVAVAPERLDMTDGLHSYEYVTGHNAAIDKMRVAKS